MSADPYLIRPSPTIHGDLVVAPNLTISGSVTPAGLRLPYLGEKEVDRGKRRINRRLFRLIRKALGAEHLDRVRHARPDGLAIQNPAVRHGPDRKQDLDGDSSVGRSFHAESDKLIILSGHGDPLSFPDLPHRRALFACNQGASPSLPLPVLDHPPVIRLRPASAFTYNMVVLLWALSTVAATLSIATAAGLTWQRLVAIESQLAQNARV